MASKKFDKARMRLSRVKKHKRGPQDPLGKNYSYIPNLPTKFDVAPSVLYYINPQLFRIDPNYSNKPPFMYAYERRLFRRQPTVFSTDPDYSTCTWTPPDHRLSTIDPERTPTDLDTLYKSRNPFRASENPYGELTDPLNIPKPPHANPDPFKVHILDEKGFFRSKEWFLKHRDY